MLITTNDYFQNKEIEAYLGQVNEQIVIGANIFRDVFASFRDVFGGQTKGYKKELDKLKQAAILGLERETKKLNGNGIIAFNMDIDEISGGGKSMFMVNVYGTAVRFKVTEGKETDVLVDGHISSELINYEMNRKKIQNQLKDGKRPFIDVKIELLIEYKVFGIFGKGFNYNNLHEKNSQIIRYLELIPQDEIEFILLTSVQYLDVDIWENMLSALMKRGWFNTEVILKLLSDENPIRRYRGLHLCAIQKSHYEKEDVLRFSKVANFLENQFNTEIAKTVEEGTFKNKVFWKCPRCLRVSRMDQKSCECGAINRQGFMKYSYRKLHNELVMRAHVLREVFESN